MRKFPLFTLLLAIAAPLFAQTAGQLPPHGGTTLSLTPPYTFVDLTRPATAAGSLTTATVRWSAVSACSNSFRVRILRSNGGGSFEIVGDRGPFATPATPIRGQSVVVPLNPPIAVQAGDLLAITVLVTNNPCGSVEQTPASPSVTELDFSPDLPSGGGVAPNLQTISSFVLNAVASANATQVVGVIPAVGATAGSNGAFFRTGMQLFNDDTVSITGSLVFHPQGKAADSADPSLAFTIPPGQTASYPDLVTQMGQTGLGSLDVVTANGLQPMVTAHVFDDAPSGTSGFYEEMVDPTGVATVTNVLFLLTPADTTNFRMNIGVRSLGGGATIAFTAPGATVFQRTYPPNEFEQKSAQDFVASATPLPPNAVISLSVTSGSAIIYSSITDNRTNDSAIHYAQ